MPTLIPEDVLEKRFAEHYAWARVFLEEWHSHGLGPEMVVNDNSLFLAVKSAYDDIYRYKQYHLGDDPKQLSNSVKRAAYLCKWLCKVKPLEHSEPAARQHLGDITGLLVNADFAQFMARVHISAECGKHFEFRTAYLFELIYDLTFREMNGDALLHIFQNAYTKVALDEEIYAVY